MKTVRSEFLNVDLDVKSTVDPAPLRAALEKRLHSMHAPDRDGRRYWIRMTLARQPTDPADAILGFSKVLSKLPPKAKAVWAHATKELDVGIQSGTELRSAEWVLDPKTVEAAARLGASIRLTVYSPMILINAERSGKRRRP